MKNRSLAGNCGIAVFVIALVTVALAFGTPNWLVSDPRMRGAKMERLGLWSHCFRSLPDPLDQYQRRFFVGCRWVYDPFTTGYDRIRGYLLPGFMIATQFFYTLCLIGVLVSAACVLMFFLCCGPDQNRYVQLIKGIGYTMLASGISACIAVIVFACFGNTDGWMPDHANNYLGWSFGLGVVGAIACIVTGALFLTEANIQAKKRKRLKESQARFELEEESRA
ncbi:uncharacterized protein LOC126971180 [Leptidea sinapis]|uniref:uncharacterized protein LOC126971180 n=1 Tax=Leptidea sinapis TaxID=189913 RepID=UPI00211F517A|nr:uncharacterized protein LOC126971180 [Leptidea sinapis]